MIGDDEMNTTETAKITVEEFGRLQSYMELTEENTAAYKLMLNRYYELKSILIACNIPITNIDRINKQFRFVYM